MIGAAILFIAGAGQIHADPKALHRIDNAFVCPESLPSNSARVEAIAKFDAEMRDAVKNLTLDSLMRARLFLLRKHKCTITLENLKRNGIE